MFKIAPHMFSRVEIDAGVAAASHKKCTLPKIIFIKKWLDVVFFLLIFPLKFVSKKTQAVCIDSFDMQETLVRTQYFIGSHLLIKVTQYTQLAT